MRRHRLLILLFGVTILATRSSSSSQTAETSDSDDSYGDSTSESTSQTERLSRMAEQFGATSFETSDEDSVSGRGPSLQPKQHVKRLVSGEEQAALDRTKSLRPKQHVKRLIPAEAGIEYDVYQGVMGRPGVDFPVLPSIPKTAFSCRSVKSSGYYADLDTDCQVFHICDGGRKISFLCPNGTIFEQSHLICDWWWTVDCGSSMEHYEESAEQLANDQRRSRYQQRSSQRVTASAQRGEETAYSDVRVVGNGQSEEKMQQAEQRYQHAFQPPYQTPPRARRPVIIPQPPLPNDDFHNRATGQSYTNIRLSHGPDQERQLPAESGSFVTSRGNQFSIVPQFGPTTQVTNYNTNNDFDANNNNEFTTDYSQTPPEPTTVTPTTVSYQSPISKSYVELDRSRASIKTPSPTPTASSPVHSRRLKPVLVEVINRGNVNSRNTHSSTTVDPHLYAKSFSEGIPDVYSNIVSSTDGSFSNAFHTTSKPYVEFDRSRKEPIHGGSTTVRPRRIRPVYVQIINRGTPKVHSVITTTENALKSEANGTVEFAHKVDVSVHNRLPSSTTISPNNEAQYVDDLTNDHRASKSLAIQEPTLDEILPGEQIKNKNIPDNQVNSFGIHISEITPDSSIQPVTEINVSSHTQYNNEGGRDVPQASEFYEPSTTESALFPTTNHSTEVPFKTPDNTRNRDIIGGEVTASPPSPGRLLITEIHTSEESQPTYQDASEYSDYLTNIDIYPPSGLPFTDEDVGALGGRYRTDYSSTTEGLTVSVSGHSGNPAIKDVRVSNRGSSKFSTISSATTSKPYQPKYRSSTFPTSPIPISITLNTTNSTYSRKIKPIVIQANGRITIKPTVYRQASIAQNEPVLSSTNKPTRSPAVYENNPSNIGPSDNYDALQTLGGTTPSDYQYVSQSYTKQNIPVSSSTKQLPTETELTSPGLIIGSTHDYISAQAPLSENVFDTVVNSTVNSGQLSDSFSSDLSTNSGSIDGQLINNRYQSTKTSPSGIEIIEISTASSQYPVSSTEKSTNQNKYRKSYRNRVSQVTSTEASTSTSTVIASAPKGSRPEAVQVIHRGSPGSGEESEISPATEVPTDQTDTYTSPFSNQATSSLSYDNAPVSRSRFNSSRKSLTDDDIFSKLGNSKTVFHEVSSTTQRPVINRIQPSRKPFAYSEGQRRRITSTTTTTPSIIQRALSRRLKTTPLPIPIRTTTARSTTREVSPTVPAYVKSTTSKSIAKILLPPNSLNSYNESPDSKKTSKLSVRVITENKISEKEEPETTINEQTHAQGDRTGLEIPPSSGPGTLHSLAIYFGSEDGNNVTNVTNNKIVTVNVNEVTDQTIATTQATTTEEENNPTVDKEPEIDPPSLLTKLTIDSYSSLFSSSSKTPTTTEEISPDSRNNYKGEEDTEEENPTTLPFAVSPKDNNRRGGRKFSNSGEQNIAVTETELELDIETTTLDPNEALIKEDAPGLRELAQVFSRALSAYLDDPEEFRKVLSEVRPTAPGNISKLDSQEILSTNPSNNFASTAVTSYSTVNSDDEEEVLDFSDVSKVTSTRRLVPTTDKPRLTYSSTENIYQSRTHHTTARSPLAHVRSGKALSHAGIESTSPSTQTEYVATTQSFPDLSQLPLENLDNSQSSYYTPLSEWSTSTQQHTGSYGSSQTIAVDVNNLFGTTSAPAESFDDYTQPPESPRYTGPNYGADIFAPTAGGVADQSRPRYGGFQNNSGAPVSDSASVNNAINSLTPRSLSNEENVKATTFSPVSRYITKSPHTHPPKVLIPPKFETPALSLRNKNETAKQLGTFLDTFIPEELNNLAVITSNVPTALGEMGLNPSSPGVSMANENRINETSPAPYDEQQLITAGSQTLSQKNNISPPGISFDNIETLDSQTSRPSPKGDRSDNPSTGGASVTLQHPERNINSETDESLIFANTASFGSPRSQNTANRWSANRKWESVADDAVVVSNYDVRNKTTSSFNKTIHVQHNAKSATHSSASARKSPGGNIPPTIQITTRYNSFTSPTPIIENKYTESIKPTTNFITSTTQNLATNTASKQYYKQSFSSTSERTSPIRTVTDDPYIDPVATTTQFATTFPSASTHSDKFYIPEGIKINRTLTISSLDPPTHTTVSLKQFKTSTGVFSNDQEPRRLIQIDGFSRMSITAGKTQKNTSQSSPTYVKNSVSVERSHSGSVNNEFRNNPTTTDYSRDVTSQTSSYQQNTGHNLQVDNAFLTNSPDTTWPTIATNTDTADLQNWPTFGSLEDSPSTTYPTTLTTEDSNEDSTFRITLPTATSYSSPRMVTVTPYTVISYNNQKEHVPLSVNLPSSSSTNHPIRSVETLEYSPSTYNQSNGSHFVSSRQPSTYTVPTVSSSDITKTSLEENDSDMTPDQLQTLEDLQNMFSLDNASTVYAEKMFKTLNESSKTALMDMMKQASSNSTVRRLVLLLVNQTVDDTPEEAKLQLIDALLKHPEDRLQSSYRQPYKSRQASPSEGERRSGSQFNDSSSSDDERLINSATEYRRRDTEGGTTTHPPITTYRNRGRKFFQTTTPPYEHHTATSGVLDKITSRSKTSLDELPSSISSESFLRPRSSSSDSASGTGLTQESDNRAVELLRSLYSLAARWG